MSSDENMNETISSLLTMKETTTTLKNTYKRKPRTNQKGKNTNISDKDSPTMRETRSMQKRKNAKDKKETKVPKKMKHQSRKSPSKRKTHEKQQLQDSDSDFESSHPSKKAKKRSHQSKKTKKKSMVKEFYSMKNRCSPEALLSIILGMSKEQKEFVRSMGFGALLKMKITDIPLKLGFYVLQKFDYERMVIDIEGKELKVTAESVHDMLGIPIGGTKLTQLDQWPKDDTSYDEWKQQFKKDSIIRLSAIENVIVSTTQADFNFKLNFLVLFVNTFCESTSMGRCNLFPLSYISRKTDISNIDWCSYVLDCLLFYADNIHSEALTVTRKRPTICYWSSEKIRYRETFEQEKGRFGDGELNEEFVNEQNEGDTDLEDSDSDKDEDHSVEAYESKISKMINSFERMKEKLNSKFNDAMTKFPEKESNEGIRNDADKNKKEGKIRVKEKDAKRNENQHDEEEKDDHAEETNNHEETIQQTKNQNLLDKVVDNIVDNVLGIGVSSLNSQEDEIWNHPEMKTIFDNIDIGSPMSTAKTNTLAEKEKSEGKENSEDRNEGGTETKNTKDGCEEKQTEIEKGNAEDRDTHPSFSLGLSQDSDQTSSKKSNESSPKKTLTKKQIKDDHQKVVIRLAKKNVLNPNPISVSIPTEVGPSKNDLDQPR
ncbi:unnamed protein product [Lactuca saligna]|uniref:Uncharacterized protein n=1 Tax=Lactuca saligna TaxID=75948 RepID=A0AA35UNJ9_LACSI|nr:unnamed protein product [Lactuca saligna]